MEIIRSYISWEMTPTSIGGEKQAGISGGVNPPADIASGRAHIVRWTMVLRRPKRSVDLQRCIGMSDASLQNVGI